MATSATNKLLEPGIFPIDAFPSPTYSHVEGQSCRHSVAVKVRIVALRPQRILQLLSPYSVPLPSTRGVPWLPLHPQPRIRRLFRQSISQSTNHLVFFGYSLPPPQIFHPTKLDFSTRILPGKNWAESPSEVSIGQGSLLSHILSSPLPLVFSTERHGSVAFSRGPIKVLFLTLNLFWYISMPLTRRDGSRLRAARESRLLSQALLFCSKTFSNRRRFDGGG